MMRVITVWKTFMEKSVILIPDIAGGSDSKWTD